MRFEDFLWIRSSLPGGKGQSAIGFPGASDFNRSSEGPLQGAKMDLMEILQFRDINGPAPLAKVE